MGQGSIGIIETVAILLKMNMARETGESIILFNPPDKTPTMILADGLQGPWNNNFVEIPGNGRDTYQFVIGGAHADVRCIFHGSVIMRLK
jgi:hypothetical protein